jgi:hypothetical protein
MKKYNCPSCGAEITFQSALSVTCVCPYCRSLVVRHDTDVETIGKMAELPDDISPFQIGTAGIYKGVHFGIIGRLKVGWEDGCWNEWFLYMDTGKKAWLAEAQGFLAVIFEEDLTTSLAHADFYSVPELGEHKTIAGKNYTVSDIKDTECVGSEGELPFAAPQGRKVKAVDLVGGNSGFAGIEYSDGEQPSIFTGEYVEFTDLHFSNLRELPGWKLPQPKPGVKKA